MTRYIADTIVTCDKQGSVYSPGVLEVVSGIITYVGPGSHLQEPQIGSIEHSSQTGQLVDTPQTGQFRDIPQVGQIAPTPQTGQFLDTPQVGQIATSKEFPNQVVRLDGLLMPGLVNTHCHSPMTLLRGVGEGLPLGRWLREAIWPREARLSGQDIYWGMSLACAEMLRNGVTTSCEMYFYPEETASAAIDAGMRSVVTPGILLDPAWEKLGPWEQQLEAVSRIHDSFEGAGKGLISVGFAAHAAYTLPLEAIVGVATRSTELGTVFHIHLAETQGECSDLEERSGCSVTKLLADGGVFDGDVLAAHCVWLSDQDIEILAINDVSVAHCPQSNAKLGSGIARVADMVDAGVNVSLGTDGPASNNNLDLWEEMRLCLLLAASGGRGPESLGVERALAMATRHGAKAVGRSDIGSLEVGKAADMIFVDIDDPVFTPVVNSQDILSHLAWSGDSRFIRSVWVSGEQVVSEGQCISVDVDEAKRQVQQRAVRIAQS